MNKINYFGKQINITNKSVDYHGSFENGEVYSKALITSFLKDIENIANPIILDVGACTGSYTMLDLIRKDLKIHSFEPSRAFFELKENIKVNGSKSKCYNVAVSNTIGVGEFNEIIADGSIALSMLGGNPISTKQCKSKEVDIITLDSFCLENKIIPNAIKIDTEGNELFVLQGAYDIIDKHHPVIYCEYSQQNANQYGYSINDIKDFLLNFDYNIEYLESADLIAR